MSRKHFEHRDNAFPNGLPSGFQESLEALLDAVGELFAGEFTWTELTNVVRLTVEMSEHFLGGGIGDRKLELAIFVVQEIDERYDLFERMDDLINFNRMPILGRLLETVDRMVLEWMTYNILIPQAVNLLWKDTPLSIERFTK